jgi:hypothetical protein
MSQEENETETPQGAIPNNLSPSPTKPKPLVTVDGSIEEINEVQCEMEADDPPVESQLEVSTATQQETQTKPSY